MHEDFKWLLGLLVIFGLIWFSSGSVNQLFSTKPFIKPNPSAEVYGPNFLHVGNNSSSGPIRYGSVPNQNTVTYTTTRITDPAQVSQNLTDIGLKTEALKQEIARLQEEKNASPLRGQIMLAGMGNPAGNPLNEFIIIRTSPQNSKKIALTGLRLQSAVTGQGVDIKNGAYLPYQNQVNADQAIFLEPGEMAYVISGKSPLGVSFRLNKCIGFLSQYQQFNPGIANRCPLPQNDILSNMPNKNDDNCYDYIQSLPGCTVITNPPNTLAPECRQYVSKELNYTRCLDRHRNDFDFYTPDWRIYLNRDTPLWKSRRELIQLLDSSGKVIDAIRY